MTHKPDRGRCKDIPGHSAQCPRDHPMTPFLPQLFPLEPGMRLQTTGLPEYQSLPLEAPGFLGLSSRAPAEVGLTTDCHTALPTTILLLPPLELPGQGLPLWPSASTFYPGYVSPLGKATSPASLGSLHNHPEHQAGWVVTSPKPQSR